MHLASGITTAPTDIAHHYGNLPVERVHLLESSSHVSPYRAIPQRWQPSREQFLDALQLTSIPPRESKSEIPGRYIALHVHVGDDSKLSGAAGEAFSTVLRNISVHRDAIGFRIPTLIRVIADEASCELKQLLDDKVAASRYMSVLRSPCLPLGSAASSLSDYEALWRSEAIVSITKRGFAPLPFAVAAQRGTPVLFLAESQQRTAQKSRVLNIRLSNEPTYWGRTPIDRFGTLRSAIVASVGEMLTMMAGGRRSAFV